MKKIKNYFKTNWNLRRAVITWMIAAPIIALGSLMIAFPFIQAANMTAFESIIYQTDAEAIAGGLAVIGGGLAALGMFGSGVGQGYAAGKAAEAVSRNPEAEAKIRSIFLVGAAIAESAALYGFVIAIMCIFVA